MDYKTYRKYNPAYLASEFRSYGRNKLEDRKLALHNDGVNKNIDRRRKSFLSEADQLNKHFNENVSKTTPSVETYLRKSQPKYNAWKLREQERLDRRYRGLYKSYLKEYSDLKLDESIYHMTGIRKLSTSSDVTPVVKKNKKKASAKDEQIDGPDEVLAVENDANLDQIDGVVKEDIYDAPNPEVGVVCDDDDEDVDDILALGQMSLGMKRHKTLSVADSSVDQNSRRYSTGGILFQAEKKLHDANNPVTNNDIASASGGADASLQPEIETESTSVEKNASPERRSSKGDNSDNMVTLAVSKRTTKRRGSLKKTTSLQLPLGMRLDRRSSLANVDIAVKYGN